MQTPPKNLSVAPGMDISKNSNIEEKNYSATYMWGNKT